MCPCETAGNHQELTERIRGSQRGGTALAERIHRETRKHADQTHDPDLHQSDWPIRCLSPSGWHLIFYYFCMHALYNLHMRE